jgi:hypothetical protein
MLPPALRGRIRFSMRAPGLPIGPDWSSVSTARASPGVSAWIGERPAASSLSMKLSAVGSRRHRLLGTTTKESHREARADDAPAAAGKAVNPCQSLWSTEPSQRRVAKPRWGDCRVSRDACRPEPVTGARRSVGRLTEHHDVDPRGRGTRAPRCTRSGRRDRHPTWRANAEKVREPHQEIGVAWSCHLSMA